MSRSCIETDNPHRGRLIALDGLNGVGKTYLTHRVLDTFPEHERPLLLAEFSERRTGEHDLGRRLLKTLHTAADGEHFLRGGYPRSETLLLLAIKMFDAETTTTALESGRTVIEGRSVASTAIYQAVITHPDDDTAVTAMKDILALAAGWRPRPDLTIVLVDDPDTALARAEHRDNRAFDHGQWAIHRRADTLFLQLAGLDPDHTRILDRRDHTTDELIEIIRTWIVTAPARSDGPAGLLPRA